MKPILIILLLASCNRDAKPIPKPDTIVLRIYFDRIEPAVIPGFNREHGSVYHMGCGTEKCPLITFGGTRLDLTPPSSYLLTDTGK